MCQTKGEIAENICTNICLILGNVEFTDRKTETVPFIAKIRRSMDAYINDPWTKHFQCFTSKHPAMNLVKFWACFVNIYVTHQRKIQVINKVRAYWYIDIHGCFAWVHLHWICKSLRCCTSSHVHAMQRRSVIRSTAHNLLPQVQILSLIKKPDEHSLEVCVYCE